MKHTGNTGIQGFMFPVGILLFNVFLLAAVCTAQPNVHLDGTNWTLTEYVKNGIPYQPLAGTEITLEFGTDGHIGGSAGCNPYYEVRDSGITIGQVDSTEIFGSTPAVMEQESTYLSPLSRVKTVTVHDKRDSGITIGQVDSTKIFCSTPGVMEQESTYLSLLSGVKTVTVLNNILIFSDAQGTPVLSFEKTVPPLPEPLIGTFWRLESCRTADAASWFIPGETITAVFHENWITGSDGCNYYSAHYNLTGNSLSIGTIRSTLMSCIRLGNVIQRECNYYSLLRKVNTVTAHDDRLIFLDAEGTPVLSFTKIWPEPLVGTTWRLVHYHTPNALLSVIPGTSITAIFDENGRVTGSAGCNNYFAQYNLTGNLLSINTIGAAPDKHDRVCNAPGVMVQEGTYLALLGNVRNFSIQGEELRFPDDEGATLLEYKKAQDRWILIRKILPLPRL